VILTVLGVVVAIAQLLGGSGSNPSQARARIAAARTTPTANPTTPAGPVSPGSPTATGTAPAGVLAQPDGACAASEITVTPVVGTQLAGRPVPLSLQLTGTRPACTYTVSPNSLVAKVTRNSNRVWSSQDCPNSVHSATVVVRSAAPTTVVVTWSGRGSDSTCSLATDWALPGSYSVEAAAIGSAPGTSTFTLTSPPRPVVTRTAHPKVQKTATTTQTPSTGH
jgi:hypothetical protein